MATNSLHSLHHHLTNLLHHSDSSSTAIPLFSSTTTFPKLTTTATSSLSLSTTTTTFSSITSTSSPTSTSSSQPTTPPSPSSTSLDLLRRHLEAKNYRQADEETRRLLIALAGESAVARGYVFFSEVQFIPTSGLSAIDELWKSHSNGKFGYSVQKKIWMKKAKKDFTKFFIAVGWMKLLEGSEVVQYNYRAFPGEFIWELDDETPEGHLPLTNALRGTQLLNCVLNHPAFEGGDESESGDDGLVVEEGKISDDGSDADTGDAGIKKVFKTDYSF